MDMTQATVLAFVQGLTEFLPISSSAHLLLPSILLGWPDQGLTFDVGVHIGSLVAVIAYFRKDIYGLFMAWVQSIFRSTHTGESGLAWMIIVATIPAGLAGLALDSVVEQFARSPVVICVTTVVFGLALYWADRVNKQMTTHQGINWRSAIIIGFAQALALVPGTSRSGITMTAALMCGLSRTDAARFSFLLAIPIILSSGLLKSLQMLEATVSAQEWLLVGYGALVSGVVALVCIHYFLKLIERIGFLPFVIYRLGLGAVLLVFIVL